ncbi:hypothetical protein AS159_09380 [Thermotoga sp. Ku-13t]|nr:hypothetical protein AS159_09380 [Thermotoga sp. Ku-13t]
MREYRLQFSRAEPREAQEFVELTLMSGEKFLETLFGLNVEDILRRLYVEASNLFRHECCVFARSEQKIVGMMLGYDHSYAKKNRLRTGKLLIEQLGLLKLFRLIKLDRALGKHEKGEFYLSNFAIYPQYRGKGFGKEMLEYCLDWAKKLGCSTMRLDVEKDNEIAMRLYSKMGFEVERESTIKLANRTFEFLRMCRTI